MRALGTPESFVQAVALLHQETALVIQINSETSDPVATTSGVRQGCPLAPLLFAIATEPLREILATGVAHSGVLLHNQHLRMGMYADDTRGYCSSKTDATKFLEAVDLYCAASGAELNRHKSAILTNQLDLTDLQIPVLNTGETERLLGAQVGFQATSESRWHAISESFSHKCKTWPAHTLSLFGRATVLNSFLNPRLQ
jgi:hypothetical protein